jgi:hypothetical protein
MKPGAAELLWRGSSRWRSNVHICSSLYPKLCVWLLLQVTSYSLSLREIDTVQDEDEAAGPDGGYVPNALEAVLRKRHLDMLQVRRRSLLCVAFYIPGSTRLVVLSVLEPALRQRHLDMLQVRSRCLCGVSDVPVSTCLGVHLCFPLCAGGSTTPARFLHRAGPLGIVF